MNIDANWLKPSVHPIYGRMLCAHLLQQGYSEAEIFEGTHLSSKQLKESTHMMTPVTMERLIVKALQLTQCPWLALEISNMTRPYIHGPLGYGAMAGPDVRSSLELVEKQLPLRQRMIGLNVEETDDSAYLMFEEYLSTPDIREFILCLASATLTTLLGAMSGRALEDVVLHLPFEQPQWLEHYREHFSDIEIKFNADRPYMVLNKAVMDLPCLMADPQVFANARMECERLQKQASLGGDMTQRITAQLLEHEAPYPKLDEVADQLNMSSRTLIRKLKAEQSSYQQILDNIRRESAQWHLRHSSLSIEQISDTLGFEDASNFSRTFQRWFDMPPSEFRRVNTPEHL